MGASLGKAKGSNNQPSGTNDIGNTGDSPPTTSSCSLDFSPSASASTCGNCGKRFVSANDLQVHMNWCQYSQQVFQDKSKNRIVFNKSGNTPKENTRSPFKCRENRSIKYINMLKQNKFSKRKNILIEKETINTMTPCRQARMLLNQLTVAQAKNELKNFGVKPTSSKKADLLDILEPYLVKMIEIDRREIQI